MTSVNQKLFVTYLHQFTFYSYSFFTFYSFTVYILLLLGCTVDALENLLNFFLLQITFLWVYSETLTIVCETCFQKFAF